MALNINRNVDDLFYRYKMPKLSAKVEGKGNGIKTVIVNMSDIAKALNRPPTYPTKYFGCELGAQTQLDAKTDRYIVNGEHDQNKLQDILDGFIKKFVLCPNCENPETSLVVKRNQINQQCKACGYSAFISLKHKLATFILRNPPPKDEADSAAVAGKKNKSGDGEASPTRDEDANALETLNGNGKKNGSSGDESEDDWEPDAEALRHTEQISQQLGGLVVNADMERPEHERLDMFMSWLESKKSAAASASSLPVGEIVAEAHRLDISDKATLLLCRLLLTKDVVNDIDTHKTLFLRFTTGNKKAQTYLLGGMEQLLVGEHRAQLLPSTGLILKHLYDQDILDEEVIVEWAQKARKKYVAKKDSQAILDQAAPFVTWLQEAEEETDESDEEAVDFGDGEDEAAPASNGKLPSMPVSTATNGSGPTTNGHAAQKEESEDDDEINIDDI